MQIIIIDVNYLTIWCPKYWNIYTNFFFLIHFNPLLYTLQMSENLVMLSDIFREYENLIGLKWLNQTFTVNLNNSCS